MFLSTDGNLEIVKDIFKKVKPGLSSYADEPEKVRMPYCYSVYFLHFTFALLSKLLDILCLSDTLYHLVVMFQNQICGLVFDRSE